MSHALPKETVVAVIGAGIMGAGIAQVAAAAGHPVLLYDAMEGAAATGRSRIEKGLAGQVAKGRMSETAAADLMGRISIAASLADLAQVPGINDETARKIHGFFHEHAR